MILTVEELGKSYGEKTLFSHVNLNINEGIKSVLLVLMVLVSPPFSKLWQESWWQILALW